MIYFIRTDLMLWAVCLGIVLSFISFLLLMIKKNVKETPFEILHRKFSMGEIDTYEYEQQKRQLQKDEDLKTKMFFLSRR